MWEVYVGMHVDECFHIRSLCHAVMYCSSLKTLQYSLNITNADEIFLE